MTGRSAGSKIKLYGELAAWWPLISPPAEYDQEARTFARILEQHAVRPVREVLELGSGGGHMASHLTRRYRMTLVDLSPGMLAVSRALNPECEHVLGDMRAVRLGRTFDAVIVHDAVMYMTTRHDLLAAMRTVAAHLEPGGVALFVPDETRETLATGIVVGGSDGDGRAARFVEWTKLPAGRASTYTVSYAFVLMEEGRPVRVEQEEHVFGLYSRATWLDLLRRAGLRGRAVPFQTSFERASRGVAFIGIKRSRRALAAGRRTARGL